MARVWTKTLSYDSVEVGDELPILVKHESQETIDLYAQLASAGPRPNWHNLHTDDGFAQQGIFGGTVNMGVATAAYVAELLEKGFPLRKLTARGSTLEMRATEPVRVGDTLTFTGQVTGKREEDGLRLIDCEVTGTNHLGAVVAKARASVAMN